MPEPEAYLNGRFLPESAARVPVSDAGFVLGATVSEQMRTIAGRLFQLDAHLARLERSLAILGSALPQPRAHLAAVAEELVRRNYALLTDGDDLGLSLFVTPGSYATLTARSLQSPDGPTIGMHTYPLPFPLWCEKYARGEQLVTPHVRQVPSECWPVELKCRSRMHYYLADREAQRMQPGARALMLDLAGKVLETTTANILILRASEGLLSPPSDAIFPGISLATTLELAAAHGIPFREAALEVSDLLTADEMYVTSTPYCLLPVTVVNGTPIGDGRPGAIFHALLAGWNAMVGIDIVAQARRIAAQISADA